MTQANHRSESALPADGEDQPRMPTALTDVASMLGAEHPVLDAQSLIDRLGLVNAVGVLRIKLAFPAEVFALAARPLIEGYSEFLQMLPVQRMGSSRFGRPGGQLQRGLTTALRALDRRRGQILPRGAAPEVIGAQAHRWTYAIFVAALLRDVVRVSEGCRVWIKKDFVQPYAWDPAVGSMRACEAHGYVVEFLPNEMRSDPADRNSPRNPIIDTEPTSGQISMTWLSIANGTRQPVPPSQSTVAVRWLMRVMVPTWCCKYLSVNETLSPRRKSCGPGL